MRCIAVWLTGLISALAAGCESKSAPSRLSAPSGQPQPDAASLKERAAALAKQVREAMTEPSIMQLDAGRTADSGLRGMRQRQAAMPFMPKLVECGKAAEEPLWQLINDADESVRRSCVILVGSARTDAGGKPIESQTLIDLNIPLLEGALTAKDAQVRFFACDGLGNFAVWSDECLERLRSSLPKLRELRNDSDKDVRAIGWVACNSILGRLATRAQKSEDRNAAAQEQEQLQREKKW
jgi:HEAT repeats